jgi:hypothetical protein
MQYIYAEDNHYVIVRLGRQGAFKSTTVYYVRAGKGLMFVVQNKNLFSTNIENHDIGTRQRNNLYLLQANLTTYQKGASYSQIKIFLIIYPW